MQEDQEERRFRSRELELADKILDTGQPAPEKIDTRFIFDYDYLWLNFEAKLRGGKLRRNSKTGSWEIDLKDHAKAILNEKGINDLMAFFEANVSIIQGSTIFENDQGQGIERIYRLCEDMGYALLMMLQENKEEYELGEGKMMVIVLTFLTAMESNLRKSLNGDALKYSLQAEHRVISEDATKQPAVPILRRFI